MHPVNIVVFFHLFLPNTFDPESRLGNCETTLIGFQVDSDDEPRT